MDLAARVARAEWAPRPLRRILARAGPSPALLWLLCGCPTSLDLGWNDAGVLYDADCKPGTYTGSYACAAPDASLFAFAPTGPVVVTLVPIGTDTLALAPDAALSSGIPGATSITTLTGMLDCSTRKLKGAVPRVTISSSSPMTNITIDGNGDFSATYEATDPPALIDGLLAPPNLNATCNWTAQFE